jgi:hypothetical protein
MANKNSNLFSGFLRGYTAASEKKKEREIGETQRKLQTKLFENQLEALELQKSAQNQLGQMQSGVGQDGPAKPMTLLDILSDPRGQQLLMQTGMRPETILSATGKKSFDPSQLPKGMVLTGVKITPDGQPMYDFGLPEVGKEVKDPSGKRIITLDKNGQPLSEREASPEEISLTPAQKAIDTKFAEEYTQFQTAGGYADVQKGIGQLNEALKALKQTDNLSGPLVGGAPDVALKFLNPEAIAIRESVEEVVQRNLRLVLGAQFTEKEGDRLIARAYNKNMSEAENGKRLSRLVTQIQQAAQAKMAAIKYYEENGTLAGFTGKIPNMGDFDPASDNIILTPDDEALINKYSR